MNALSNAELAVVSCLPEGLRDKEIARRLNIAESTVKHHIKHALKKLGLKNRVQAAILVDRQRADRSSNGKGQMR